MENERWLSHCQYVYVCVCLDAHKLNNCYFALFGFFLALKARNNNCTRPTLIPCTLYSHVYYDLRCAFDMFGFIIEFHS